MDSGRQEGAAAAEEASRPLLRPRRRVWLQRWAAVLLVPLALFLLAEGLLRLTGYGYPSSFFLKGEVQGRPVLLNNTRYGWRFFGPTLARECWPFALPADKVPGTIRVFVLGESAAMGDPDPRFGLPRMVESLLNQRFPDRRFEVVNTAFSAINSHVILPIARECARYEGDLWVVYMGNNEVEGPFGSGSVFGRRLPPLASVRASLWLKSARLGQGLDAAVRGWSGAPDAPEEWGGMEMLLENKVRQGDSVLEQVYDRFRVNLDDILDAGRRAGVPIVLCTVAANLRDCSPFASLHGQDLSPADVEAWNAVYQSGVALESQGDSVGALGRYQEASRLDAGYADLWFRIGRNLEALGRGSDAAESYRKALDADVLRFRADTRLNQIVREEAEGRPGVRLFDAEALLARRSRDRIPGAEFFFDHVHLTVAGNYRLARGIAEEVAAMLRLAPRSDSEPAAEGAAVPEALGISETHSVAGPWPSQNECERWLGLTDRNQVTFLTKILRRRSSPPFSDQLVQAAEVQRLQGILEGYREATRSDAMARMGETLAELTAFRPGDPDLRSNYAAMLQAVGDVKGAEQEWRQVISLLPHAVQARLALGLNLESQGRKEEAVSTYRACLKLSPHHPQARARLAALSRPVGE